MALTNTFRSMTTRNLAVGSFSTLSSHLLDLLVGKLHRLVLGQIASIMDLFEHGLHVSVELFPCGLPGDSQGRAYLPP